MTNATANRPTPRPKPQTGQTSLKMMIAVGSLAATLIGADLIARRDAAVMPVETTAPVAIVIPASASGAPAAGSSAPLVLDNAPIPELVIPQPVARSRSSR